MLQKQQQKSHSVATKRFRAVTSKVLWSTCGAVKLDILKMIPPSWLFRQFLRDACFVHSPLTTRPRQQNIQRKICIFPSWGIVDQPTDGRECSSFNLFESGSVQRQRFHFLLARDSAPSRRCFRWHSSELRRGPRPRFGVETDFFQLHRDKQKRTFKQVKLLQTFTRKKKCTSVNKKQDTRLPCFLFPWQLQHVRSHIVIGRHHCQCFFFFPPHSLRILYASVYCLKVICGWFAVYSQFSTFPEALREPILPLSHPNKLGGHSASWPVLCLVGAEQVLTKNPFGSPELAVAQAQWKRVIGGPAGLLSNVRGRGLWSGDTDWLTCWCFDYFMKKNNKKPRVNLSKPLFCNVGRIGALEL